MNLSQTKKDIVEYITSHGDVSVKQLVDSFGISKQAMHRHLNELVDGNQIYKIGRPPKVFYKIKKTDNLDIAGKGEVKKIDTDILTLIQNNFQLLNPDGTKLMGIIGFVAWCNQRNFSIDEYAIKYSEIYQNYESHKDENGLVDARKKIRDTFLSDTSLDGIYYREFATWEIFGKTKMYENLLYAKQTEDRILIKEIVADSKDQLANLIKKYNFEAVGYIPPAVPRQIQLMKEIEKSYNLNLPKITITKIRNDVIVPQKTLKKLEDRIVNADSTFVVADKKRYSNILLIDDFVGSGASMNEVAKKIRINDDQKIYGFALCGSPNGVINDSKKFEVINEP